MVVQEKSVRSTVLEGAEVLLVEWGHALNALAFTSKEGFNSFKEIEEDAATHWFQKTVGKLPKTKTAYEATVKYRDIADEKKVILKDNFKLEEKGEIILGTFLSQDCPYKRCCIERKKERKQYVCFRATPFITAIKLMADKFYKSEVLYDQTSPGSACIVRGMPTELAFKVGLSYKLSKGTVKVHELDCEKIGIGIIDNVTIRPSRKEITGRKLIAMSYSQTKYPPGMILMNITDAKSLGLEEKDTVFITKAGEKEEVTFVEEEKYEAKPGEYEIPGLEVEEEPEKKGEQKEEVPKEPEKEEKKEEKKEEVKEELKVEEKKEAPKEKPKEEAAPKEKLKPEPKKEKKFKPKEEPDDKKKKRMEEFEAKIEAIRNA